jgi:hypothetical protein
VIKPFSIQAPEEVAKEYGGNKQKIAQAAQMGIVDPTAAVLAGMFIDKMRSAQMMEAAQKPSIAQQVLGAPQPQAAPMQAGIPAQTGAPAPAPMGAPQDMAPPQGMAEGGIIGLDVPDGMYDEPSNGGFNDGYAGGGLVAFGSGGKTGRPYGGVYTEPENYAEFQKWADRIINRESGYRYGVTNTEGSGAMGLGQIMPKTGKVLAQRANMPWRPDLMTGTSPEAKQYQQTLTGLALREAWNSQGGNPAEASGYYFAGPNRAGWGSKTRDYIAGTANAQAGGLGGTAAAADSGLMAGTLPMPAPPKVQSLASQMPVAEAEGETWFSKNVPAPKNEGLAAITEEARKTLDPAEQKKRASEDKWMALAEIGFNMAATNSPYLLQAVGAAAAAALPGAKAAKKEREADKRQAIRDLADAENITYKQALEKANAVHSYAKDKIDLTNKDIVNTLSVWQQQAQETGAMNRAIVGGNAGILTAQSRPSRVSDRESMIQEVISQGYAKDRLSAVQYLIDNGYIRDPQQGLGAVDANGDGIPDNYAKPGGGSGQGSVHLGNI